VPERLYLRAPFEVDDAASYPVDVVVHAEGADAVLKSRYVLRIRRRPG
jgi:hypothetical protein